MSLAEKTPAVALDGVTKTYGGGERVVRALDGVSLASVHAGASRSMRSRASGSVTATETGPRSSRAGSSSGWRLLARSSPSRR
jgi:hypothetical protein